MGILTYLESRATDAQVDVDTWKHFAISDYFTLTQAKGDNQAKLLPSGDIPLISAGSNCNGVTKYVGCGAKGTELLQANVITVDMFGKAFYQGSPFYAVSHGRINILTPKFHLTRNIALFIVSVLDKTLIPCCSYDNLCSLKKLVNEEVCLPATKDGDPDWDYMENYVKCIYGEIEELIL